MSATGNHLEPVQITFFPDYAATTKREEAICLHDLADLIITTTAANKKALPWLKLARFGDAKTPLVQKPDGKWTGGSLRHNANLKVCTGVEADYDQERVNFSDAVAILSEAGVSAVVYTSPSYTAAAPRWRVLCQFSKPMPPEQRDLYMARLNGLFRGIFARESWTLSQSYYFGSINGNPDHRVELIDGTPIDLLDELDAGAIGKPETKSANGSASSRPVGLGGDCLYVPVSDVRLAGYCRSILEKLRREAIDGQKHHALLRAALLIGGIQAAAGFTDEQAIGWLLDALPASVVDWNAAKQTAAWGLEQGRQKPIDLSDRPPTSNGTHRFANGTDGPPPPDDPPEGQSPPDDDDAGHPEAKTSDWVQHLQRDERGGPIANLANAMTALRGAPELAKCFAFDQMAMAAIIVRPVPHGAVNGLPRPVEDGDVSMVQEWLQRNGLRRISRDTVHQAVDLRAAEKAFHPVREYLNALRWDGKPRLSSWLHTYLGAAATPYTSGIGPMFLTAMVARVFMPGCKVDYVMILEGLQGALKSTAGAILGDRWFTDALPDIGSDAVRLSQHLRAKWLVELSELSAMSRAETEDLKSFITRREEQFTPKYGRREVKEPRQCVFLGTTNRGAYLRDETGARRFWPVKVGTLNTAMLARDRDQLFAEAVQLFRASAKWWPDADFERQHIRPQQEARFEGDAWEQALTDWLAQGQFNVTILKVAKEALFIETPKLGTADQRRIAAALEQVGWKRNPDRGPHGERYWMKISDEEDAGNV